MYHTVYWNFKNLTHGANHIAVYNDCCRAQYFEQISAQNIIGGANIKLVDCSIAKA